MTDQTATHPNSGLEVNSIADRIEAALQPETEPEAVENANPSTEPADAEAGAEAATDHVLQPDEVDDAQASDGEEAEAEAEADDADQQADEAEAASDEDTEAPETLAELAEALEVEDLSELRVSVKIDGEESEVPISEAIRGYQRQQSYDSKMLELRGEREKFDAAVDQATKLWQSKLAQMESLVTDLEAQVSGQEPDWNHVLDTYGSEEFLRQQQEWNNKQSALAAARAEKERVSAESSEAERQRQAEYAAEEQRRLFDAWPELADEASSKAQIEDMTKYLQAKGYTSEELAGMLDHRMYLVARDAMRFQAIDSAKPATKKKVKGLPKVLKPKATKGKQAIQQDKIQATRRKLRNSGSVDDAADVFKQFGL